MGLFSLCLLKSRIFEHFLLRRTEIIFFEKIAWVNFRHQPALLLTSIKLIVRPSYLLSRHISAGKSCPAQDTNAGSGKRIDHSTVIFLKCVWRDELQIWWCVNEVLKRNTGFERKVFCQQEVGHLLIRGRVSDFIAVLLRIKTHEPLPAQIS